MVPGIEAIQDVLEVLFESELGVESNSFLFVVRSWKIVDVNQKK